MTKGFYLPKADAERVTWLKNFATRLPNYSTKYGLAPSDASNMQAAADFLAALIPLHQAFGDYRKSLIEYKEGMMESTEPRTLPQPPVIPPGFSTAPAAGIFGRVAEIVNKIKAAGTYTTQDGQDLGIEGPEQTVASAGDTKPAISLRPGGEGQVEIVWKKAAFAAIEFELSLDGGATWTFLGMDTSPNYTDSTPVTAAQKRSYRAIYRDGNGRVGQWNDVASTTVG
ncbi:MAG: hypothetical protein ABI378_05225 [Chitinophagaceae bacterium]